MIRISYCLLSLLQAVLSQEWKGNTPRYVKAQEGLCAQIPCHYRYPSSLANQTRVGIWFKYDRWNARSVAFHSKYHNRESPWLRHRIRLSGDLKDGDCSLIINDITQQDAGPYYFRIEFSDNKGGYSYKPDTRLQVSGFTDKPTIFPAEIIEGKRVDVSCTFNTTCKGTAPVLTWVKPAEIPGSVSSSVTQHGITLTYTAVLTLIPSLKHHGKTLTCRVRYPSVSSERTLALTVQPVLSQEWKGNTPRDVTAQEGLCAQIPCNYSYPSSLTNQPRTGIWFNNERQIPSSVAFHSKYHNRKSPRLRHRIWLSGDLKDGDCSLIINDITKQDAGLYYFRIEFSDNKNRFSYKPVTKLHVSVFTDKPTIFPAEIIEGKRVDVSCTFNTTCKGTAPVLTWVKPADIPGSVSRNVTEHGVTLTYTAVLTLIPSVKHHGKTLTCRVSYPSVSSERTVALTVQHAPQNLSITSLDTIKDSLINIKEGNSAVILCSVTSFPASNLTWRHLGLTVNRTTSNNELWLEFANVTSRVAGDYQCVAENGHGAVEWTINITVEHAPRNLSITSLDTIKDSSINIKEGNSAVILCSVTSIPASNLTWRHLGLTMNRTTSNNELWLEFANVTSRITGDYQCVAENEHGAVERTITITVEHPPKETTVAISGATGGIREGDNIMLTCSSESVPPASSYAWFRVDGNMITQLNTSARSIYSGHLTRANDASFYCTARNPLGNGTSTIVHLSVEYKPEISRESECTRTAKGVTCLCVARSNPPGDLTWHLPLANVSAKQTSGHFVTWRVSDGQLVTGSLTLTGREGEEEATVFCSVRNQHGEAMFKVYLWAKGRDSNKWQVGLLVAGIMLSVELAGFLTFKCMRKRKAATERDSQASDIAMTDCPLSVKYQGTQSAVVVDPWNTTSDATSEAKKPAPRDFSEGPAGKDAGHGQPDKHEDLLYANINFLKLPSGDGTVHRGEVTEYARIRFQ